MERVGFVFKNGHKRVMAERQAMLLSKAGFGTYQTRALVADVPSDAADAGESYVVASQPAVDSAFEYPNLDLMDKEQLHALAKERGVKVHHLAGAEKVRAALRDAPA